MNRRDIILLLIVSVIICFLLCFFSFQKSGNKAYVYHENDLIQTIDLSIDKTYTVVGDNGNILIEVKDHQIKVNEENSPRHLCSKQGYINKENEAIVCLPNKVIIKIASDKIDTQVK